MSAITVRLANLGVRLWLEGDSLRYSIPEDVDVGAVLAELKANRDAVVAEVDALEREAAAMRASPIAAVVAGLADLGFAFRHVGDTLSLETECGSVIVAGVEVLYRSLHGREKELDAFLRKPVSAWTGAEAKAMGFSTRSRPGDWDDAFGPAKPGEILWPPDRGAR